MLLYCFLYEGMIYFLLKKKKLLQQLHISRDYSYDPWSVAKQNTVPSHEHGEHQCLMFVKYKNPSSSLKQENGTHWSYYRRTPLLSRIPNPGFLRTQYWIFRLQPEALIVRSMVGVNNKNMMFEDKNSSVVRRTTRNGHWCSVIWLVLMVLDSKCKVQKWSLGALVSSLVEVIHFLQRERKRSYGTGGNTPPVHLNETSRFIYFSLQQIWATVTVENCYCRLQNRH